MVRLKTGVSLDYCRPEVYYIVWKAAPIWTVLGSTDLWITGANESGHSTGPRGFHRLPNGTCQALDLRTWTIPRFSDRRLARDALAAALGPAYDVLFETELRDPITGRITRGEHMHVQFDPERPGTKGV